MTRVETIGSATLYLGDCRDVLPTLGKVDAVVTDPPYGIGFRYSGFEDRPEDYPALIASLPQSLPRIALQYPEEMMRFLVPAWGAPDDTLTWIYNSNLPRQTRIWGFWGCSPDWSLDPQLPKNSVAKVADRPVRSYDWFYADLVKGNSLDKTKHPCQLPFEAARKPISLIEHEVLADPFMGSGTIGVAAVQMGRKFIGIEREPKYFEIALKRIEDTQRQGSLFGSEAA